MSGFSLYLAETTESVTIVFKGNKFHIYSADTECTEEDDEFMPTKVHVKQSVLLERISEIFGQIPNTVTEVPLLETQAIFPSPEPFPDEPFLPFDKLSVVTVTIGAHSTGEILDLSALFSLLPLSFSQAPGSISFAGYEDIYRGRLADPKKVKKNFCDAISMRMQLSRKEIFVKLYSKRAHICGIQAPIDIEDFCNNMKFILKFLEDLLENIRLYPNEFVQISSQFLDSCKGNPFMAEEVNSSNEVIMYEDHFLNTNFLESDNILINYLQSLCLDNNSQNFFSHNDLRKKINAIYEYALSNKKFSSVTDFASIEIYMFNRNFKLPFLIDREKICAFFDGKYGFYAMMDPVKNKINITHRVNQINNVDRMTKRGHILMHHFSISYKGSVSLSNEGGVEARDVYYKFVRLMIRYRNKIELDLSVIRNEVDTFKNFINSM